MWGGAGGGVVIEFAADSRADVVQLVSVGVSELLLV